MIRRLFCRKKESDFRGVANSLDTNSVKERIIASGIFNEDFYRKTYGEHIENAQSPLDHFLDPGLANGFLPSPDFDPALYRLLTPACGDLNPVVHYLDKGGPAPTIEEILPNFKSFAKHRNAAKSPRLPEDAELNRKHSVKISQARILPLTVKGVDYQLLIPEPDFFLDRLQSDQPFAFARLPHGFWDALLLKEHIEDVLADDPRAKILSAPERSALAARIGMKLQPHHGAFAERFMDDVCAEISTHADNPDFFLSIAFNGFPTWDEQFFLRRHTEKMQEERLDLLAKTFTPEQRLYDARQWKRLLIAGDLRHLPEICSRRHVILVASDYFADLGNRWRLKEFSHICIPRALSQWHRWELLARLKDSIQRAKSASGQQPPVVLMQCGGSLAFWLISRLFSHDPEVFYLDLGQALNGWFFDKEIELYVWTVIYARPVIENCGLAPYYRNLIGDEFEAWFASLSFCAEEQK